MKELLNDVKMVADALSSTEADASAGLNGAKVLTSVTKLPGDASDRRYYRLETKDRSYILMRMESFKEAGDQLPFLVVRNHLAASDIDVPAVLDLDPARGCVLLEDLGDVTLLRRLQEVASGDLERHLYERVIDQLVKLQVSASPRKGGPEIPAFKLRFDYEKLMWEVNFAIEHFYELYLKREIRPADRKVMVAGYTEICKFLEAQPTVLAHRDFHSRNIMAAPPKPGVKEDRLVMIDFQDARLGPAQYDLASLLRDSYYQLEETQIERLIDYYISRREAMSGEKLGREEFWHVFDMMTIQRNFKAIGSFASFLNRRGNATYLKYIGNTFENIRRTLLRHPRYSALREVMFHYYYF